HFDNKHAVLILREMNRVARRGIVVIDLHRHPVAYFLYTTAGRIILHNRLLREDGALSILRSFRPEELYQIARAAGLTKVAIELRFACRLVLRAPKSSADRSGASWQPDEYRLEEYKRMTA